MNSPRHSRQIARFGIFEADLQSGELWKRGLKIRLQEQPFKVLKLLLEHPGELVTRDELQQKLWPDDTFVDFDEGLNSAILKVRHALGDSAERPRFVETLPRRGYRFITSVEREAGPSLPPPVESLAVLPLQNLTGDPSQEYFVDGMTDTLIANLTQIGALRVISRTSVMQYKGTPKPMPQIARELNVDAVVEGAVARSRDRVRITAQLIHAPTDQHLWAKQYERDFRDVLLLQSEVARAIANEIQVRLTPQEQARLAGARSVNPEAYEAHLKGRFHWNKRTEEELKKGIAYFEQAIEKDPAYALAYAGLADCYNLLGATVYGALPPREAYPRAKAAAAKALEIEEALAEPHTSLAWAAFAFYWDFTSAEREFRRAIELNPNYATAHHWYAFYLVARARWNEAISEIRRARDLDPVSLIINTNVGVILYFARQYDEAIDQFRRALELDPGFVPAYWSLEWAYEQKGRYEEAITAIEHALRLSGGSPVYDSMRGHAYAVAGKRAEAQKVIEELQALSNRRYVSPFEIALVYIGLGDTGEAFRWLDRAYEERSFWLVLLNVDPRFDHLRSDQRFQDLVRRVGL